MPSPVRNVSLDGLRVWVTRPAHQARTLSEQIRQAGGQAVQIPLMAIESVPCDPQRPLLQDLAAYQYILFVSANAVSAARPHLEAAGGLRAEQRIGVVGKGTARAVREHYQREPDLLPEGQYDSEGLLALPALQQVNNAAVLIVRGEGGRETLARTLRQRGARVDYLEVYHRRLLPTNLAEVHAQQPQAIVVSSSEAVKHLALLATQQGQPWVLSTALIVFHPRIADLARELGFTGEIRVTQAPGDGGVVETLEAWVQYTGDGSKEEHP